MPLASQAFSEDKSGCERDWKSIMLTARAHPITTNPCSRALNIDACVEDDDGDSDNNGDDDPVGHMLRRGARRREGMMNLLHPRFERREDFGGGAKSPGSPRVRCSLTLDLGCRMSDVERRTSDPATIYPATQRTRSQTRQHPSSQSRSLPETY